MKPSDSSDGRDAGARDKTAKKVAAEMSNTEKPATLKGETRKAKKERLTARKALTLKVFRAAYENHRRLKEAAEEQT